MWLLFWSVRNRTKRVFCCSRLQTPGLKIAALVEFWLSIVSIAIWNNVFVLVFNDDQFICLNLVSQLMLVNVWNSQYIHETYYLLVVSLNYFLHYFAQMLFLLVNVKSCNCKEEWKTHPDNCCIHLLERALASIR